MSRPVKYSDAQIADAAATLLAEGQEINATRVRLRLGGGNLKRIQNVLYDLKRRESRLECPPNSRVSADAMAGESFREQVDDFTNKCWAAAKAAAAEQFDAERIQHAAETASLSATNSALEKQLEGRTRERDSALQELDDLANMRKRLTKECEQLALALRTAESDKRAAERAIELLEQSKREDRREIRGLQKRLEKQAAEIAILNSSIKSKK